MELRRSGQTEMWKTLGVERNQSKGGGERTYSLEKELVVEKKPDRDMGQGQRIKDRYVRVTPEIFSQANGAFLQKKQKLKDTLHIKAHVPCHLRQYLR